MWTYLFYTNNEGGRGLSEVNNGDFRSGHLLKWHI